MGLAQAVWHEEPLAVKTELPSSSSTSPQTHVHLLVWLCSSESHISSSKQVKKTILITNLCAIINWCGKLYLCVCSGIKPRGGLCPFQGGKLFCNSIKEYLVLPSVSIGLKIK